MYGEYCMFVNDHFICIFAMFLCLLLASCASSTITVLDAESQQPIPDVLIHAYSHEIITVGPRQNLYVTDKNGKVEVDVSGTVSLRVGKEGYYPLHARTKTERSIFTFWKPPFAPVVLLLNRVHKGTAAEARRVRNHGGLMFFLNNPPDEQELMQLLHYSHWVYVNTQFYEDSQFLNDLEDLFRKKKLPVKEHKDNSLPSVTK